MPSVDLTLGGQPVKATLVTNPAEAAEFSEWVEARHGELTGCDVESNGLPWFHPDFSLTCVAFADDTTAWVLPFNYVATMAPAVKHLRLVAHNSPYDAAALVRGVGVMPRVMGDSMTAALLETPPIDPTFSYGLKAYAEREGWHELTAAEDVLHRLFKQRGGDDQTGWALVTHEDVELWTYNALDAVACYRLRALVVDRMDAGPRRLLAREEALQHLWLGSTLRGQRVDYSKLAELIERYEGEAAEAEGELREIGIRNPRSHKALLKWFTDKGATFSVFTKNGNASFGSDAIPSLTTPDQPEAVQQAALILERYNIADGALSKLGEFDGLSLHTGRLHPWIKTLRAKTGRMSIADPALQNLPKGEMRQVLVVDEGHTIVGADFSQVEFRVAAALSRDERMTEAIANGQDLHDTTARAIWGDGFTKEQRQIGKTVGFGWLYGGGANALSQQARISFEQAQEVRKLYGDAYPGLREYVAGLGQLDAVRTPTGRLIPTPEGKGYVNTNFMIQSTARDLLAEAVLRLADAGWADYLWLPIHDEVLLHVPDDMVEDACAALEHAMSMTFKGVPIDAEAEVVGDRWGAAA